MGVFALSTGPPISIEQAQAMRGFAHVPESALESFLADKGKTVAAATSQTDADRKLELSMAAIAAVEPEWTDIDAAKALHRCFLLENPDTYSEVPVDIGVISEVVAATEAKDISNFADKIQKARAKRTIRSHNRDLLMNKYFKISASSQKAKAKPKAAPRWWPKANEQANAVALHIEKNLPSSFRLYTDIDNGRYKVISNDHFQRSISWTSRGLAPAAAECIYVAWDHHKHAHPADSPPFELSDLERQFRQAQE